MKKNYALIFCLFFSSSIFLPAQEVYVVEEEIIEVTPEPQEENSRERRNMSEGQLPTQPFTIKDYAHWSISVDGGFNVFQGDMKSDFSVLYKNPFDNHWSVGGNVEFTVNPMYSLGISYMYSAISGHDNQAKQNGVSVDRGQFTSNIHHIAPFIGINLLNFPLFNRNRNWDFWINAGVGAAHHNSELNYRFVPEQENRLNGVLITEDQWYNTEGIGLSKANEWVGFVPLSFELSYSITRQFIIGLKYKVNFYLNDNIEGGIKLSDNDKWSRKNYTYAGVSSDVLSNFLLTLRWDITPKDKVHIRKLTWREFRQRPPRDPRIDDLARRLDSLENQVANIDLTPIMIPVVGADCQCDRMPLAVYFDFDKYNLDREALIVLKQVAFIMNENPSYTVEVRGYTDIVGSVAYNEKLSQRRADAVKNELVRVFNIAPERIVANGEGKATEFAPTEKKYHPVNRRCDFFFIDNNK